MKSGVKYEISRKERRNAADLWTYALRVLAILGWSLFVCAIIVSYYAAPDVDYGILRYHNIEIRKLWLTPIYTLFYC